MPRLRPVPAKAGIRRSWTIKPLQKPHSTKKGKKGYSRKSEKKKIKEAINSEYAREQKKKIKEKGGKGE